MSSTLRRARCAALVFALAFGALQSGAAGTGAATASVHVRGATTLQPMAQYMAEAYMSEHPAVTVAVSAGGTVRGYKSIMDGTADVALVSGAAPGDLRQEMDRRGIKLLTVTAAYNAIVPVVHPGNPIGSLSPDQLRNIFTGRIKNWKYLGGKNAHINVYIGPPSGGITEAWREAVIGDGDTYTPGGIVLATEDRIRRVAADPLAISFIAYGSVKSSIKPLKVNEVAVSVGTVLDGSYVLRTPLMLATTDRPSAAARDFVRYFATPRKRLRFAGIVTVETLD